MSTNIVSGATNSFQQLYLKDLITGAVSVVSSDAHGAEGNNDSSNPANSGQILMFSPDGRKALFESAANNLGPAGTNGLEQIFIKHLTAGSVTLVSTDGHGVPGNANSMDFTFSPDGTKVAFDSHLHQSGPRRHHRPASLRQGLAVGRRHTRFGRRAR